MDEAVIAILARASETAGVDFTRYRAAPVGRRLAHRMRLRGCASARDYQQLLDEDPAERWRLIDALLIKTTRAFRDLRTLDALSLVGLPDLIARCVGRGCSEVRVWVAGCASGEEAYGYAIALLEARERAAVDVAIRVVATDVDPCALERAARGVYPAAAFANVPSHHRERYLVETGPTVAVAPSLRGVVTLARHDLLGASSPIPASVFASFDLVSCCNLLLYFDEPARRYAIARLLDACEPGGILVLGEAEHPPLDVAAELPALAPGAHAYWVDGARRSG